MVLADPLKACAHMEGELNDMANEGGATTNTGITLITEQPSKLATTL